MTRRMKVDDRKVQLLTHAIKLAEGAGYTAVTRQEIAREAGVSEALLSVHFGTMPEFRKELMRHAIKTRAVRVLAQGLVAEDPIARRAPADLKQLALASITA